MSSNSSELNSSQTSESSSNSFELKSPQTSESSSISDYIHIEDMDFDSLVNPNVIVADTYLGRNILNLTCQYHGIFFHSSIMTKIHHNRAKHPGIEPEVFDDSKFQTFVDLIENCSAVYQIPKNSDIGASLEEFIDNGCDVSTHMKNFNCIWISQDIPELKRNWDAQRDLFSALQSEKEQFIIIKHRFVARLDGCSKDDLGQPRRLTIGRKVYMVATII